LVRLEDTGPVMTRKIAERQNLPEPYLEQLMMALKRAGILKAVRGAHGGYMLARSASDISTAEIIRALEGELAIADCDDANCCSSPDMCAIKDLFDTANSALATTFGSVSLAELASRQTGKESSAPVMYHI